MNNNEYLIELLRGAVTDKTVAEPDENIDFDVIYDIAKRHNVQTTAYYGLKKIKGGLPDKARAKWENAHLHGISGSVRQLAELKNISAVFTKENIVHLPLKGSVMKHMYASPDMRAMADMDILIRPEDQKKVYDIMMGMGYSCEIYGKFHHDVYKKEPIYNIEIHVSLFDSYDGAWYDYYNNILDRTSAGENEYVRVLGDEDFYVYNIAHFAKHFQSSGSGIRSIMDIYVMKKAMPDMDMDYVNKQLEKLELSDFYRKAEALEKYWFEDGSFDAEIGDTADYVLSSGTYGTVYNMVKNQVKTQGGVRSFLLNAFLPYDKMIISFGFLKKLPFLLPFCWIARWVIAVVTKPQKVWRKVRYIVRADKEVRGE